MTIFFSAFKSLNLLQSVTSTVNQVCRKLKIDEKTFKNVKTGRVIPCSVHAVKNGRRKMEDRHVLIHDLNAIYCDNQVRKTSAAVIFIIFNFSFIVLLNIVRYELRLHISNRDCTQCDNFISKYATFLIVIKHKSKFRLLTHSLTRKKQLIIF